MSEENIIGQIKELKIKKLTDVGFTREQAEVLVEMLQNASFGFGL